MVWPKAWENAKERKIRRRASKGHVTEIDIVPLSTIPHSV
jgi:hypothetical protein